MARVELHVHSDSSLLDGKQKLSEIINYCKENKVEAIALTEHGNMVSTLKFHELCKKEGIKNIVGCEFYYVEDYKDDYTHLILLAKNDTGYKNLLKLQYYSSMEGFYYKPRINKERLIECSEGLVCLSACVGGIIPKNILNGNMDEAMYHIDVFKSIFNEDFYLEIQPHIWDKQKIVNNTLQNISNVKLVATSDAHYASKEDANSHDTILCIKSKKKKDDEERFRYETINSFLSDEEMIEAFKMQGLREDKIREAFDSLDEIKDKCNVDIQVDMSLLPKYSDNAKHELAKLCNKKYAEKLNEGAFDGLDKQVVIDRIKYELKVINQKGYADYFLINYDFLKFCDDNNIARGVGRGSVAGSEVAFLLDIHMLEPIRHGLLFERFLNPTRNSHPDIDNDFCYEERDKVIEYVAQKYGRDNTCTVIAEGHLACSNVIRRVMSAYGYESAVINKVSTKMIPKRLGITLKEAYDESSELKNFLDKDERLKKDCFDLEDNISHFSKHAAGIVIAPDVVYKYVPVMRDSDNVNIMKSQWDKKQVEHVGLYKFDFLGLKLLTTMKRTLDNIKRLTGQDISLKDLYRLDMSDESIYRTLQSGNLCGIFQFEGYAGRKTIDEVMPTNFEEIMACESICRPGVKEAELYVTNRKSYRTKGSYDVPSYWDKVKHILEPTYGAIVYQEQTMILFNEIGGFTLGEADALRKVKSLEPYRARYVTNAVKKGFTQDEATELFDRFDLGYSFNKSHAGVYGVTSGITCYLKDKYFTSYMSAYMSMEVLKDEKESSLRDCMMECKNMGIVFIPPDINKATHLFEPIDDKTIMLPITFIKGLGDKAVQTIIKMRPYKNVVDFVDRVPKRSVNKTSFSKLIKAGVFDSFNENRQAILEDYCKVPHQFYDETLMMVYEREVLGFNLGKHPLDNYINTNILDLKNNEQVCINAIIIDIQTKLDKNGNEMAFVKCENKECVFETVIFSYVYKSSRNILLPMMKINIQGNRDNNKMLARKISLI